MMDERDIANGLIIPSEGYCDEPYVAKLPDGTWLCVMTTGQGHEGQQGQHIVSCRSTDCGQTWSALVDIEPADGPEASWAMPFVTPAGRVYVFYTYNASNLREVRSDDADGSMIRRVDSLGEYAFKYSDDGGHTWSKDRRFIPVREFEIDRRNPYGGSVRFFWGVGKPIQHEGMMYIGFTKVLRHAPHDFFVETEGCFLQSDNIMTEADPDRIRWQTLPDGDIGLRSPGKGPICEETYLAGLSDGSLIATCRTVEGYSVEAYSRNGGRAWTVRPMRFFPDGPIICNPRGPNFVRKLSEGRYAGRFIYWFYNNNACGKPGQPHRGYDSGSRNPAWLSGGVERDSPEGKVIHWGRPEVILYDVNLSAAIGYPDFVEVGDRLFITETQKSVARVHEVPQWLLDRLWDMA